MDRIIKAAIKARKQAYAPYSSFTVGAAVLTADGSVYAGCNIENASYPVGICAERVAMSKAVSEGAAEFDVIAIVGGPADKAGSDFCSPCGMCRQFMREFAGEDFKVVLARIDENEEIIEKKIYELGELLPDSFGKE